MCEYWNVEQSRMSYATNTDAHHVKNGYKLSLSSFFLLSVVDVVRQDGGFR